MPIPLHYNLKILYFDCVLRSKILKLILFFGINLNKRKLMNQIFVSGFVFFDEIELCVLEWKRIKKNIIEEILRNIQQKFELYYFIWIHLLTMFIPFCFVLTDSTPAWRNNSTTYCISSAPRLSQRTNATAWRAFGRQKTAYYTFRK